MKLHDYGNGIFYLTFATQKDLTLTMARIQEYYECGNKKLRGKVFDFGDFLEVYTQDNGEVNYFAQVTGFNIPGNVVNKFFAAFYATDRETKLLEILEKKIPAFAAQHRSLINLDLKYYLIATVEGDNLTLDHELLHAHFYLNEDYKKKVQALVKTLRPELRKELDASLTEKKYAKSVFVDEINAFLSTEGLKYLKKDMCLSVTAEDIKPFKALAKTVLKPQNK